MYGVCCGWTLLQGQEEQEERGAFQVRPETDANEPISVFLPSLGVCVRVRVRVRVCVGKILTGIIFHSF